MHTPQAIGSFLSAALRDRTLWLLAILTSGLTLGLRGISPIGISFQAGDSRSLAELTFFGTVLGASLGAANLHRTRTPLRRAATNTALLCELATLLTPTTVLAAAAAAPSARISEAPAFAMLLVLAHTTAAALLLVRLRLPAVLLPILVWVIPAFLGPNDPRLLVRIIESALNPTQAYAILEQRDSIVSLLFPCLSPIIGLLGFSAALTALNRKL